MTEVAPVVVTSKSPEPEKKSKSRSPEHRRRRSSSGSRSRSRSSSSRSPKRSRRRSPSPDNHRRKDNHSDGHRVHVGNLDESVSERDLEDAFGRFGSIIEIWLASYAPFYAFVKFRDRYDAEDAIRALNNTYMRNCKIRTTMALARRAAGDRPPMRYGYGSSGGGGYGGGSGYGGGYSGGYRGHGGGRAGGGADRAGLRTESYGVSGDYRGIRIPRETGNDRRSSRRSRTRSRTRSRSRTPKRRSRRSSSTRSPSP